MLALGQSFERADPRHELKLAEERHAGRGVRLPVRIEAQFSCLTIFSEIVSRLEI